MSRKRGDAEDSSRDVLNVTGLGLSDLSARYHAPTADNPRWELPNNAEIVEDFERSGSQLDIFLAAVTAGNSDRFTRQLLLSALLFKLRTEPEMMQRFDDLRLAGEEARLMLLEEQAFAMAQYDPAAFKFILEKRKSDKYGKAKGEGGDDEQTKALKEWVEKMKQ